MNTTSPLILIEIVGRNDGHVYMRYHRSPNPADNGRFMIFKSNPVAHWLDDYEEAKTLPRSGEKTLRAAAAPHGCSGR